MNVPTKIKYIGFTALLIVTSINMVVTTRKIVKNGRRLKDIREDVLSLEQEREQLIQEINDKKTQEYIERTAREELNLVKPNEEIYIYPEEKDINTRKLSRNRAKSFLERRTPLQQWIELIFK